MINKVGMIFLFSILTILSVVFVMSYTLYKIYNSQIVVKSQSAISKKLDEYLLEGKTN